MKWVVTLHLRSKATSEQLKDLAETLEVWSDRELRKGICIPEVDDLSLEDLGAGELPQPEGLRKTRLESDTEDNPLLAFAELMAEANRVLHTGPNARDRAVYIYVRSDVGESGEEATSEEVVARIDRLRSRLPTDVIKKFTYRVVPDEYEEPDEDED